MFAKLAEWKLEAALAGILLAIASYFVFNYFHKDAVIDQLKTTVVTQQVENVGLKDQVKDQQASGKIDDAVAVQVKTQVQALQDKGREIFHRTAAKVTAIEKSYEKLPSTDENADKEDKETSVVIIDGVWDTFCTVKPEAPECTGKAKPNQM